MNKALLTSAETLRFPYAEAPPPGTVQEVAPGVSWLRMPLPFALDHINLWVLDDGDSWTLVDTGINTDATRALWDTLFAGPLKGKPVARLICTHFHPDHIGLAGWLAERHGVALTITDEEWGLANRVWHGRETGSAAEFYTRAGFSRDDLEVAPRNAYAARVYALPASRLPLDPEASFTAAGAGWRVVVGEGHSPQLAALHSPVLGLLISGDQVLPGISPNVSVFASNAEANPLKDFLESLSRFRSLPEDTLVLPSHKLPFFGLRLRIDQIAAHHVDRLAVAKTACEVKTGATAMDVLRAIFPRALDRHQIHFALGETIAHLNYLRAAGHVERATVDGVDRYHAAAGA